MRAATAAPPLVASGVAAAVFVVIQQSRHLEDTRFLIVLGVFSLAAAIVAAALSLVCARGHWLVSGCVAFVLVPAFFVGYITVRLAACLVTGCDMS